MTKQQIDERFAAMEEGQKQMLAMMAKIGGIKPGDVPVAEPKTTGTDKHDLVGKLGARPLIFAVPTAGKPNLKSNGKAGEPWPEPELVASIDFEGYIVSLGVQHFPPRK